MELLDHTAAGGFFLGAQDVDVVERVDAPVDAAEQLDHDRDFHGAGGDEAAVGVVGEASAVRGDDGHAELGAGGFGGGDGGGEGGPVGHGWGPQGAAVSSLTSWLSSRGRNLEAKPSMKSLLA